jgi:RNA polymerase sigma-70 factor (ECF subfamily)
VDTIHLVKRARAGDKEALLALIMQQKQDYYRLAYTYTSNDEDAMDAMEDMIVIVYENIDRIKKPEAFYSWSKTILVNCCRKILRKKKNLLSIEAAGEQSHEVFPQVDRQMELESQLSLLQEKHQEVLKLRYYLDLDYQQIADILKIPLGTVKSRISTGLMKLAEGLGGEGYE